MNEQRNLIVAIVLSVLILVGFNYLNPKPPVPPALSTAADGTAPMAAPAPAAAAVPPPAVQAAPREQVVREGRRITVDTPTLHGSIALVGARIDDLTLKGYRETAKADSAEIALLQPTGTANPYFAQFGWVSNDSGIKLPDGNSVWQPVGGSADLTPATPVTLSWDNGDGLRFVRTIAVDKDYMFTLTDRVENYGTATRTLYPYAYILRTGTPTTADTYILHEGPLGVLDGSLKEVKYKDLRKEPQQDYAGTGGWIGITDKYWLTALIPAQASANNAKFRYYSDATNHDHYQVDMTGTAAVTINAGASTESTFNFFAGTKTLSLLDGYAQKLGIDKFELSIDFGWFWFLTKPFFYLLVMLKTVLGNMGLAILAITVLVKLAMFPLAQKSFVSMNRMKEIQPQLKKLQERYADDKARLQQEMMDMYKREKINPASGCLPMLIQIPVFFSLYKVLYVAIEMRHAPFVGWIQDLSAPDPTTIFNLFGMIDWMPPGALAHLGVWPIIMGVSMWLQQKMNPQPTDPMQAKMFQFLPLVFTFMLGQFAAGLVIYWTWSNALSILQQWVIARRHGARS